MFSNMTLMSKSTRENGHILFLFNLMIGTKCRYEARKILNSNQTALDAHYTRLKDFLKHYDHVGQTVAQGITLEIWQKKSIFFFQVPFALNVNLYVKETRLQKRPKEWNSKKKQK